MSAVRICPNCKTTVEFQNPGRPTCAACGAILPAPKPGHTAAAQAADRQRPSLLLVLMVFMGSFATIGIIITFLTITVPGNEDYIVDNRLATQSDFLVKMLPFILLYLAAAPIAYGLWKERPWTRPLLVAFFAIPEFGKYLTPRWSGAPAHAFIPRFILSAVLIGLLIWYLYKKRNVVRYYEDLSGERSDP
jgi:hypothetical protein